MAIANRADDRGLGPEKEYESSHSVKKQATAQTFLASLPRLSSSDQQGISSKKGPQSSRVNRQASDQTHSREDSQGLEFKRGTQSSWPSPPRFTTNTIRQTTAQTLSVSPLRLSSSDQTHCRADDRGDDQGLASKRGPQSSRANRQASDQTHSRADGQGPASKRGPQPSRANGQTAAQTSWFSDLTSMARNRYDKTKHCRHLLAQEYVASDTTSSSLSGSIWHILSEEHEDEDTRSEVIARAPKYHPASDPLRAALIRQEHDAYQQQGRQI